MAERPADGAQPCARKARTAAEHASQSPLLRRLVAEYLSPGPAPVKLPPQKGRVLRNVSATDRHSAR